ncbi:hypothetical protein OCH239_02905 [Roseivivax halodurans JCM 10272]|uniref:DUF2798 domain-containing protein n=1 Tax=Roseivivax halodurans JCM 10272 TaxID=1449350 RepID=X7EFC9_9RHOB|nr:hypothetical protein [Roseivivax halodurans]ETX14580.1 hypothetical protein OCH239_02905 [Roseivivax halodurans JCM 10272]
MSRSQRALFVFITWLCVYPGVLVFAELVGWIAPGAPVWLRILLSTAVTVPTISMVILPRVTRLVAAAKGQSVAELKRAEARAAESAG